MAETTKTTTKKNTVKKTQTKKPEEKVTEEVFKYKVKEELDPHMLVQVRNGYHGRLVFIDKKTGEEFNWDEFGDSQDMELTTLKYAKSAAKRFFTDNWFIIDDPTVIKYLGLESYYKNALDIESFESLFEKTPEEIEEIIPNLSNGQKKNVIYKAREAIVNDEIRDLYVIRALEKTLGVELIER